MIINEFRLRQRFFCCVAKNCLPGAPVTTCWPVINERAYHSYRSRHTIRHPIIITIIITQLTQQWTTTVCVSNKNLPVRFRKETNKAKNIDSIILHRSWCSNWIIQSGWTVLLHCPRGEEFSITAVWKNDWVCIVYSGSHPRGRNIIHPEVWCVSVWVWKIILLHKYLFKPTQCHEN